MSYDGYLRPTFSNQKYFYKSNIIRYRPGWSKQAVAKFLGEPDKKKYNRYKKGGPKRCLYLRERVFQIEKTEEFKKFALESNARRRHRTQI